MAEVLERGNIYFFYRPRVEEDRPEGLEDVQRMYVVLEPHGKSKLRRVVVGQKKLPDIKDGGEKVWGFIDMIESHALEIHDAFDRETYETETRGERELPAARPAGEGVYAIAKHEDHAHLAYALELPQHEGDVQRELHIENEASYVLSVKNPNAGSPRAVGLREERKAHYPQHLQEKFEGRRFIAADPVDLLDYEGTELLLIGAKEDAEHELEIALNAQDEDEDKSELLDHLRLEKDKFPRDPLLQGRWT